MALLTSAAVAKTTDPAYLEYDGGAALLGPNDEPFSGIVSSSSGGNAGPLLNSPGGAATVSLSFEGVSQYDTRTLNGGFSFIPPDTMGAVGATQFMETTNGGYAVFDKATGTRTALISDGQFWTNAGQVQAVYPNGLPEGNGDARVLFDARSQKWIAESFGANLDTIQIAVSTTSDALGPWKSTSFTGFAGGIADYPTLAIDKDAVYIGTNDFSGAKGNPFEGETLSIISRGDLFGATPTTTSLKQFFTPYVPHGADPGFAIQGVNQLDNKDSGKILAVSIQTSDLIRYDVANPGQSIATLSNITYLGTKAYVGNNPGAQPGDAKIGGPVIDTLDDRVSSAVWEANGKIYAVHTVTPTDGSHTVIVYTVSDATTDALIQEGTIGDANHDYYQGSIAVNSLGQVVIGYDRSGPYEDGKITFYAQTFDSLADGGISRTGTFLLHVSNTDDYHNGSVEGQLAAGRQRWGDYAQVTVDPNNPESFWAIGEFAREPNNDANGHPGGTGGTRWGTWISDLTLAAVPEPSTWAMMLVGFGGLGAALRGSRRKRVATA